MVVVLYSRKWIARGRGLSGETGGSRKLYPMILQNSLIMNTSGRDQKGTELLSKFNTQTDWNAFIELVSKILWLSISWVQKDWIDLWDFSHRNNQQRKDKPEANTCNYSCPVTANLLKLAEGVLGSFQGCIEIRNGSEKFHLFVKQWMFFIQFYVQKWNIQYQDALYQSNYKIFGSLIPPMRTSWWIFFLCR